MPLSKCRLKKYQRSYGCTLVPMREFDNDTSHPVVMMSGRSAGDGEGKSPWMVLMCPCDLAWEHEWQWSWKKFWKLPLRTMILTGDGDSCRAKEMARQLVRNEARATYKEKWTGMPLPDAIHDIWLKSRSGEYMGEFDPGMLYAQDVEDLLGTTPSVVNFEIDGESNGYSFPSTVILTAIGELRKRKLLDLSGMILVPYKESFRFPDSMHHKVAYWFEGGLGAPNGDAGDGFLFDLYRAISAEAEWESGEEVFGKENIPDLAVEYAMHPSIWFARLDARLSRSDKSDKAGILQALTVSEWVVWLKGIQAEISVNAKV